MIFQISFNHYSNGFCFQRSNVIIVSYCTLFFHFQIERLSLTSSLYVKTLKKEGRAFRNIGKNIYIPDCKISLASFVLYFYLLLIRSFIRIRSFVFVSWSLLQKSNWLQMSVIEISYDVHTVINRIHRSLASNCN